MSDTSDDDVPLVQLMAKQVASASAAPASAMPSTLALPPPLPKDAPHKRKAPPPPLSEEKKVKLPNGGSNSNGGSNHNASVNGDPAKHPKGSLDKQAELTASKKPPASASTGMFSKMGAAQTPVAGSSSKCKPKTPLRKEESDDDDDRDDEDAKKWYEKDEEIEWKRGGEKWKTLEWNGVLFPPLYEPHHVAFKYDGVVVPLTTDQEEVATMYAAMLETSYAQEPVFNDNFMLSWRPLLKQTAEAKHVNELKKCDFSAIKAHLDELQAKKKGKTSEEKKKEKIERDKLEQPYLHATVDGRKEKLGNFRVEPPGLFRGRGAHPKMGKLKARIWPEDITLNMSKNAKVPPVPDLGDGKVHQWGAIEHKNTVTWLAKWIDSINGDSKCVWLAANSSWKGQSDKAKYEKARELKKHIAKVRADYTAGMASGDLTAQQKSVAVYLIDRLALRVGGEKDTGEEADTVGCCSLRVEHVKLDVPEPQLHLNFLGKDSIEYDNTNEINPRAYKLILKFMKSKTAEQQLFSEVQPSDLNEYFHSVMDGLSAKVFRTYNASITLCQELHKTDQMVTADQRRRETDVVALCNYYTLANKQVAILCNHQKAASANHGDQMAKMDDQICKVKAELKQAKEAKLPKADALQKKLDKLEAARRTKDETKCVSLGTSKINYNDPRITIAWCKTHDVPIQKQFPKTLLAKFAWAMSVEPEFLF